LEGIENPFPIRVVDHIVEIRQALLFDEFAQDVHVAVRLGIGGEDVVVRDDHDLVRSQTLAFWPNSRLNTPIVPGPQTSWVISTSAFTQMLSPASTRALPEARARIFYSSMVEPQIVVLDVAGSNPVGHPIYLFFLLNTRICG
jgi:hypothetical protein